MRLKYLYKIFLSLFLITTIAFPSITSIAMDTSKGGKPIIINDNNDNAQQSTYLSGWIQEGNKKYYYENNVKKTGWLNYNNKTYYLNILGEMQTSWMHISDNWYYFNDNGEMQLGWTLIKDKLYYFNEDGKMLTGWINLKDNWYFSNEKGEMQTGWLNYSDKWYYLNNNGERQSGWLTINNKKYYLNPSGERQTGWIEFDGKWCYFYETGEMASNTRIDDKYIDENGYYLPNRNYKGQIDTLLNEAYKHLGKEYAYGGAGPDKFDCSGFTSYVYKTALGIDIGRIAYDQLFIGREVSRSELKPGDLIFPTPDHVAIYIGNSQMIHAPRTGDVVKISAVYTFWRARRLLEK